MNACEMEPGPRQQHDTEPEPDLHVETSPEPTSETDTEEGVPPVAILPLPRDQWQRDEDSTACSSCGHAFTMYWRRHHCRKCGKLFCGNCAKARHAFGTTQESSHKEEVLRVCVACKASLSKQED
eukprot:COSAG02_NODE_10848_length_1846_cov_2.476245_2_plen_125_part_00